MENEEDITEGETEVLDFTKPDYRFVPETRHGWIQRGPYLICGTCDLEHATYISMERMMVGATDDGTPILEDRV